MREILNPFSPASCGWTVASFSFLDLDLTGLICPTFTNPRIIVFYEKSSLWNVCKPYISVENNFKNGLSGTLSVFDQFSDIGPKRKSEVFSEGESLVLPETPTKIASSSSGYQSTSEVAMYARRIRTTFDGHASKRKQLEFSDRLVSLLIDIFGTKIRKQEFYMYLKFASRLQYLTAV